MLVVGLDHDCSEPKRLAEVNGKVKEETAQAKSSAVFVDSECIDGGYCLLFLIRFNANGAYNLIFIVLQNYVSTKVKYFLVKELPKIFFHLCSQVFALSRKMTTLVYQGLGVKIPEPPHITFSRL